MQSKQKIYIKPVGTVRPCNKLPAVQCRNGYKMNLRMQSKQKIFISSVGANSMFSKKTCRLAMRSPVCSGFSQNILKPVILSKQRSCASNFWIYER